MKIYSYGECYLDCIKADIKKKYNIENVIFLLNFEKIKDEKFLIDFFNKILLEEKLIRYKKIENNLFEIKDFPKSYNLKVCEDIVKNFLTYLRDLAKKKYNKDEFYIDLGGLICNEKEAFNEILLKVKRGFFNVYDNDPYTEEHKLIFPISFSEESEIYFEVESGYLELEYKD